MNGSYIPSFSIQPAHGGGVLTHAYGGQKPRTYLHKQPNAPLPSGKALCNCRMFPFPNELNLGGGKVACFWLWKNLCVCTVLEVFDFSFHFMKTVLWVKIWLFDF